MRASNHVWTWVGYNRTLTDKDVSCPIISVISSLPVQHSAVRGIMMGAVELIMCSLRNEKDMCFLADLGTPQCFPKGAGGG